MILKRRALMLLLAGMMLVNIFMTTAADTVNGTSNGYIKWSTIRGKDTQHYNSIAYGSGRFVSVGYGGFIQASEDGEKWRRINDISLTAFRKVIYNGSTFVAAGENIIMRSADGLKWEIVLDLEDEPDSSFVHSPKFIGLHWSGTSFYAFGQGRFYSSPDGSVWKQCYQVKTAYSSGGFNGTTIDSLASSGNRLVATAIEDNYRVLLTSEDGSTWKKINAPNIAYNARPNIFFNGKYFIVPGIETLIYSEDGYTWNISYEKLPRALDWVKDVNGKYYGSDGKSLYISTDGFVWEKTSPEGVNLRMNDISGDRGETLVIVGDNNLTLRSVKNDTWSVVSSDARYNTNSTATDGKLLVAVGDYGQILVTKDGSKWDRVDPITWKNLQYVVYAEKRFVAGGEGGEIFISSDGYRWHRSVVPTDKTVRAIAYGAGRFAAACDGGALLVSETGEEWKQIGLDPLQDMGDFFVGYSGDSVSGIVYTGKYFIAVTSAFTFRSVDGLSWERLITNNFKTFKYNVSEFRPYEKGNSLLWDGKRVLVTTEGMIGQTENGEKWAFVGEAPYWGKQLFYFDKLYFSDINVSSEAIAWETGSINQNLGDINWITSFKGKLYAFGINGMLLRGELLSRPEATDISVIWSDAAYGAPSPLKGIKQTASNGRLCIPVDIISNLAEGHLKVGIKGSFKLVKNGTTIDLKAGSSNVYINGKAEKLPAPCYISEKRLMVPAAYLFDKLGIRLEYNNISKVMTLTLKQSGN